MGVNQYTRVKRRVQGHEIMFGNFDGLLKNNHIITSHRCRPHSSSAQGTAPQQAS